MIRVLLVDDQALFREGLHTLLSVWDDINVVGLAANGEEAVQLVADLSPDVVLMDLRMPIMNGATATRHIVRDHPASRVIALTTFDDDETVFDALRAGAAGYLLKDVSSTQLVEAIRTTAKGESMLDPAVAAKLLAAFSRTPAPIPTMLIDPLSNREQEILSQIATGASNREIANMLFIAEGTVKNHVTNILGKLGVRDRTQAALKARELGLL